MNQPLKWSKTGAHHISNTPYNDWLIPHKLLICYTSSPLSLVLTKLWSVLFGSTNSDLITQKENQIKSIEIQAVSDLRINLSKSSILPVGQLDNIQILAGVLDCKIESLPIAYLGLPLGATFKEKAIWDSVIGRLEKRLSGWRAAYLSKGED